MLGFASGIGRYCTEFVRYYVSAVVVLGVTGELFNVALRVWSGNQVSFYSNGLWQVTCILAFFLTLHTGLMKRF
ncbi:hypothetical protein [Thaumasiovibrio subtropicus]|uniref:hypothetical protein n=1 Tax=Thaumasiovibrio subtropicus TaxID=1891207 RepID=UPI000B34F77B|nr:hypothetical protein [Thaumasiovibrio subtropicus]